MAGPGRAKPVVLVVIDGLTPAMFEAAETPALRFLAEHGEYRRAASVFPSLTPVCLASIATGSFPDVHEIPHLVWWHRGEHRLVEYGSSFGALRAAGLTRGLRDTIVDLNAKHLSRRVETVYETLESDGLTTAAINITCYRGTHRHLPALPGAPAVYGPRRFFFYSLYESDPTGAPIAVLNRSLGSIDAYAAAVGRWLVTRDGFDLLVYYLPDYDFASHAQGPDAAHDALRRSDAAVGALLEAAGGPDEFLDRYALVVCSDHGQSKNRDDREAECRRRSGHRLQPRRDGVHAGSAACGDEPGRGVVRRHGRVARGRRARRPARRRRGSRAARCGPGRASPRRAPPSATRTPARCSSLPRRATSSSTSRAGITEAAAATGRSTRRTRRSRCSPWASARRRSRSPGSRRSSSTTSGLAGARAA